MPPLKEAIRSENPVVQKKVIPPPTLEKLSELACLLSKNESDEPKTLVERALKIWRAANEELSGIKPYQDGDQISFDEIAEKKMLPSQKPAYENLESSKGVGKIVTQYFKSLFDKYDEVMRGRQIDPQLQKTNKNRIEQLGKMIDDKKKMPKRVLDLLTQFQLDMRKQSHQFSASEIRELLGGANVGIPSPDL